MTEMSRTMIVLCIVAGLAGTLYYSYLSKPSLIFEPGVVPPGADVSDVPKDWLVYRNNRFSFTLYYPKNYFLEEKDLSIPGRFHYAIILTADTEENRLVREGKAPGREGPVAITLDIYQNDFDKRSALQWIFWHTDANFKLGSGFYTMGVLGGAEAVMYSFDGLYHADATVAAHGDAIFMLTGTYLTRVDEIHFYYKDVLDSFRFL